MTRHINQKSSNHSIEIISRIYNMSILIWGGVNDRTKTTKCNTKSYFQNCQNREEYYHSKLVYNEQIPNIRNFYLLAPC